MATHRKKTARNLCVLLLLLLLGAFTAALTRPAPKPQISIAVQGYETWTHGPQILAKVVVTNIGQTTIAFSPSARALRTENKGQWIRRQESDSDLVFVYESGTLLLPPGAKTTRELPLPLGTTDWQLIYTIRNASGQYAFDANASMSLNNHVARFVRRLLSNKDGPPVEISSPIFRAPGAGVLDYSQLESSPKKEDPFPALSIPF